MGKRERKFLNRFLAVFIAVVMVLQGLTPAAVKANTTSDFDNTIKGVCSIALDSTTGVYTITVESGQSIPMTDSTRAVDYCLAFYDEDGNYIDDFLVNVQGPSTDTNGVTTMTFTHNDIMRHNATITAGNYDVALMAREENGTVAPDVTYYNLTENGQVYFDTIEIITYYDLIDDSNSYPTDKWSLTYDAATDVYTLTGDTALSYSADSNLYLQLYNDSFEGNIPLKLTAGSDTYTFTSADLTEIDGDGNLDADDYHVVFMVQHVTDGQQYAVTGTAASGKVHFNAITSNSGSQGGNIGVGGNNQFSDTIDGVCSITRNSDGTYIITAANGVIPYTDATVPVGYNIAFYDDNGNFIDDIWISTMKSAGENGGTAGGLTSFDFVASDLSRSRTTTIAEGDYNVALSVFVQTDPVEEYRYNLISGGNKVHFEKIAALTYPELAADYGLDTSKWQIVYSNGDYVLSNDDGLTFTDGTVITVYLYDDNGRISSFPITLQGTSDNYTISADQFANGNDRAGDIYYVSIGVTENNEYKEYGLTGTTSNDKVYFAEHPSSAGGDGETGGSSVHLSETVAGVCGLSYDSESQVYTLYGRNSDLLPYSENSVALQYNLAFFDLNGDFIEEFPIKDLQSDTDGTSEFTFKAADGILRSNTSMLTSGSYDVALAVLVIENDNWNTYYYNLTEDGRIWFDEIPQLTYYDETVIHGVWTLSYDKATDSYILENNSGYTFTGDELVAFSLYNDTKVQQLEAPVTAGTTSMTIPAADLQPQGETRIYDYYHVVMDVNAGPDDYNCYGLTGTDESGKVYFAGYGDLGDCYYTNEDTVHGVWSISYDETTKEYTISSATNTLNYPEGTSFFLDIFSDWGGYVTGIGIPLESGTNRYTISAEDFAPTDRDVLEDYYHVRLAIGEPPAEGEEDGTWTHYGLTELDPRAKIYFPEIPAVNTNYYENTDIQHGLMTITYDASTEKYTIAMIDKTSTFDFEDDIDIWVDLYNDHYFAGMGLELPNGVSEHEFTVEDFTSVNTDVPAGNYHVVLSVCERSGQKWFGLTEKDDSKKIYFPAMSHTEPQEENYYDLLNDGSLITDKWTLSFNEEDGIYTLTGTEALVFNENTDIGLRLYSDSFVSDFPIDVESGKTEYTFTMEDMARGANRPGNDYHVVMVVNDPNASSIFYALTGNSDAGKVHFDEVSDSSDDGPMMFDETLKGFASLTYDSDSGVYTITGADDQIIPYTDSQYGVGFNIAFYDEEGNFMNDIWIDNMNPTAGTGYNQFEFEAANLMRNVHGIPAGEYNVALSVFVQSNPVEEYRYNLTESGKVHFDEIAALEYSEMEDIVHGVWTITYNEADDTYTLSNTQSLTFTEGTSFDIKLYNNTLISSFPIEVEYGTSSCIIPGGMMINGGDRQEGLYHVVLGVNDPSGNYVQYGLTGNSGDSGKVFFHEIVSGDGPVDNYYDSEHIRHGEMTLTYDATTEKYTIAMIDQTRTFDFEENVSIWLHLYNDELFAELDLALPNGVNSYEFTADSFKVVNTNVNVITNSDLPEGTYHVALAVNESEGQLLFGLTEKSEEGKVWFPEMKCTEIAGGEENSEDYYSHPQIIHDKFSLTYDESAAAYILESLTGEPLEFPEDSSLYLDMYNPDHIQGYNISLASGQTRYEIKASELGGMWNSMPEGYYHVVLSVNHEDYDWVGYGLTPNSPTGKLYFAESKGPDYYESDGITHGEWTLTYDADTKEYTLKSVSGDPLTFGEHTDLFLDMYNDDHITGIQIPLEIIESGQTEYTFTAEQLLEPDYDLPAGYYHVVLSVNDQDAPWVGYGLTGATDDSGKVYFEGMKGYHSTYTVTTYSYDDVNGTASIADISGGGIIMGREVAIQASVKPGYSFVGWYEADIDENGDFVGYKGECADTNLLIYGTIDCDLALCAVYKANTEKVALNLSGYRFIVLESDEKLEDAQEQTIVTRDVTIGEQITLIAADTDAFLYWKNSSGRIVSKSSEYTFTVSSDVNLTMVYKLSNDDEESIAFVEFVSDYNYVIAGQNRKNNEEFEFPEGPLKYGVQFNKWSMSLEEIWEAILEGKNHIRITPIYHAPVNKYTITVQYPDGTLEDDVYANVDEGKGITISAKDIEGKQFAYWSTKADGSTVLSYNQSYYICANSNQTLYPIYKNANADVEKVPVITMTGARIIASSTVSFEVTRSVPEGYEVVETGMLYSKAEGLTNDNMVYGAENVYKEISQSHSNNGVYILNITISALPATVYARGYMILRDLETGNLTDYIYTDVCSQILSSGE